MQQHETVLFQRQGICVQTHVLHGNGVFFPRPVGFFPVSGIKNRLLTGHNVFDPRLYPRRDAGFNIRALHGNLPVRLYLDCHQKTVFSYSHNSMITGNISFARDVFTLYPSPLTPH